MKPGVTHALLAAVLFGASTPLAKLLIDDVSPFLLAGILYFGSGLGLSLVRLTRDRGWRSPGLSAAQWPWLLGAIGFGGVLAPVLLMFGLNQTSATTASLLLNLETVLTAALAWLVFRENADRRIVAGKLAIVAGGVVLSWPDAIPPGIRSPGQIGSSMGPFAVCLACFAWAIDNNLTRKVALSDSLFIAASKGLIAGSINCVIAWQAGASLPAPSWILAASALGFVGYGVSLVLFVIALRALGTARTGAYFATAPFVALTACRRLRLTDALSSRLFPCRRVVSRWRAGCGCARPSRHNVRADAAHAALGLHQDGARRGGRVPDHQLQVQEHDAVPRGHPRDGQRRHRPRRGARPEEDADRDIRQEN